MMRHTVIALAAAVVALALTTDRVSAQPPPPRAATLALDCRASDVSTLTDAEISTTWLDFHPDRVFAQIQPLIEVGAWGVAMDTVIARARGALQLAPAEALASYNTHLAETDRLFKKLLQLPENAQSRFMADSVRSTRWQLNQNPATGVFVLFAGPSPIRVTGAMAPDERRAICWPAIAISGLLTMNREKARDETVRILTDLAAKWDSYIDNSYSQLPWELLLNGLGRSRRDWNPPGAQWILLHPSAGVEVAGLSWKNLNRVDVAALEAFGRLWYNKDYTRYWGFSAVTTFASDRAMAVGGYAHLWFPQAKVGYVVRPDSDRKRRQSLLVTVDLYDLLTGVPKNLTEAKAAAIAIRTAQPAAP